MKFAKFMASMWGRILRIVAGIVLIYAGFYVLKGTGGLILAIIGVAPLAAGIFDFCIIAPLFGAPFKGRGIRNS